MKSLSVFLIAASFVAASEVQGQTLFDSLRWKYLSDSAWHELRSYDHYDWAFQWDSIFLVRWTSWTCDDIHAREDERRDGEDAYLRKRFEETSALFPEYTLMNKRKDRKVINARP